jgi:hypothetical protein
VTWWIKLLIVLIVIEFVAWALVKFVLFGADWICDGFIEICTKK